MSRIAFLYLLAVAPLVGAERLPEKYEADVSRWEAVQSPPRKSFDEFYAFMGRANSSDAEWTVAQATDGVRATLGRGVRETTEERPKFSMKMKDGESPLGDPMTVYEVADGWLAAYNRGEFGAALWWYSKDGAQRYHISNHQVNQFICHKEHIFAVEGLAHMGSSEGSLIELTSNAGRWSARTFVDLPGAGEAVCALHDGRLCVATSDMLLAVALDRRMEILIPCANWGQLYPQSIAYDVRTASVYVGMRQFVARYDLSTTDHTFRLLIPDRSFLNKNSQ
jgi:hypothetical protein